MSPVESKRAQKGVSVFVRASDFTETIRPAWFFSRMYVDMGKGHRPNPNIANFLLSVEKKSAIARGHVILMGAADE
jgi:hypothetical protein